MAASIETATPAEIAPDEAVAPQTWSTGRIITLSLLALLVATGFWFRAAQLGAEGLSEDELNKLYAVEDYRARGLSSKNGEHPMLMKALITVSVVAVEDWNALPIAQNYPALRISTEAALRIPGALVGALTTVLVFLVAASLFGPEIGLIAAALWALDPSGISFNRIAKEDSFLLFFFLLANVFWLRSQRLAETGSSDPTPYYWATAAAFGAMVASKYMPHFLAISASYYHIFQGVPRTRWRLGKRRWLLFFAIMGLAFLICNPAILLPETWHEMKMFASERRIGHDAYEFMGQLYPNQMSLWLKGVPWSFYFVFMAFKLPVPVIIAALVGLPLLFRRRLGDGRYFMLFWLFFWFLPFTVLGGKFTRYFAMALPAVLITAAVGAHFILRSLSRQISKAWSSHAPGPWVTTIGAALLVAFSALASARAAPHYRLYTNILGGGAARAGSYFPHDEFYDASVREAALACAQRLRPNALVASETPDLFAYYAQMAGRQDLVSVSLSDKQARQRLQTGDCIIVARGRRYFSNVQAVRKLQAASSPTVTLRLGATPSAQIFILDRAALAALSEASGN